MNVVDTERVQNMGSAEACPQGNRVAAGYIGIAPRFFNALWKNRVNLVLFALVILAFVAPHLGHAEDLLADQKQDAKDTFGHGSTVEWAMYTCEVLLSIGAYIKVRNPMILIGGIPFLIIVTKIFFSLIG